MWYGGKTKKAVVISGFTEKVVFDLRLKWWIKLWPEGLMGRENNVAIEKYAGGARRLSWKLTHIWEVGVVVLPLFLLPPPIDSQFSLVSNIRGTAKQVPSMLKTRTSVLSFHKTAAIFPESFCWHWRFMRSKSICDLFQIIFKPSAPPLLQSVMTCYWHTFFPVLNKP